MGIEEDEDEDGNRVVAAALVTMTSKSPVAKDASASSWELKWLVGVEELDVLLEDRLAALFLITEEWRRPLMMALYVCVLG